MANVSDLTRTLAWNVLLLLLFRCLTACTYLFVSINASIFIRSSIRVHSKGEEVPFTTQNRNARPNPNRCDGKGIAASTPKININKMPRSPKPAQRKRTSSLNKDQYPLDDRDFSISPKQQNNPNYGTIMKMYEEIIASDAETINVQQATIQSQQEIIRSQRDMIQKMQQLIEAQDTWIEENLEEASG